MVKFVLKIGSKRLLSFDLSPEQLKKLSASSKKVFKKPSDDQELELPRMSTEEKTRLKKDLMEALRSGDLITGPLRGFLRKYGLVCSNKDKIDAAFRSFGDNTLWALKRVLKSSSLAKEKEDHVEKKQQDDDGRSKTDQKLVEEEKMDIRARIKAARAAKEALNGTAEALQLRRKRERERLEEMERTAVIDDNLAVLREFEKLCQGSLFKNPLEQIGLRLKEEFYSYEYMDEDPPVFDDLEEGEIRT